MGRDVFAVSGTRVCPMCDGIISNNDYWMPRYPIDADWNLTTGLRHRRYCCLPCIQRHEMEGIRRRGSSCSGYYDHSTGEYYSKQDFENSLAWDIARDNSVHVINGVPHANATGEVITSLSQHDEIVRRAHDARWKAREATGWIPR